MKKSLWLLLPLLAGLALSACDSGHRTSWQGYFEGEYVLVASPIAGRLDRLDVARGDRVAPDAPLFSLDTEAERASAKEAAERLAQARARLDDIRKGQRPEEISAQEARLAQARAATDLSARELDRASKLKASRVLAESDFDIARLTHEKNIRLVEEIDAQLALARLGGREDAIAAAAADVAASEAALARTQWSVEQKTQTVPQHALVFDTLFRVGELVQAGSPVVSLLPPENLKIRFFVPESEFGSLKAGEAVKVTATGFEKPIQARITYLSPEPEYTPPVLYNRENRAKLVFMVEATPLDPASARDLHPGQPADVSRP